MQKNDIVTIRIEDLTQDGLGIGHAEGMAVFVKDTVIGDFVRVKIIKQKKTYSYGRLEEIILPSPFRIRPSCAQARACGGCQIQMMTYEAQLEYKQQKVKNALVRIGGFDPDTLPMEPVLGMEEEGFWHYRNKAQYPVGTDAGGNPVAGFYAGRTHSIIRTDNCLIGVPENADILEMVLAHMKRYHILPYDETTGAGLVRHVMTRAGFTTGQLMVCLVIAGQKLPHAQELVDRLRSVPGMTSIMLNHNLQKTNVILGKENTLLWGTPYIEDAIGPVLFRISPQSFFQVNPVQTKKLYQTALSYADLSGTETVWDLYCGIGTISLFLAQKAGRVFGVEIVPEAIEDAKRNAQLNRLENVQFYAGKAEEILPERYEKEQIRADVIVVDPPRKGCDRAVLDTMLAMSPSRIVYVSCDPATLARDLKILCEGGYELQKVRPCDMFPHTVHVECVVLMLRKNT